MSRTARQAERGGGTTAIKSNDPHEPTPMVVRVTNIRPYDHNPRCERNAAYNEIYTAIRAKKGLDTALTITRRPTETSRPYMAKACNTRLQVLQNLYAQTEDEDYGRVNCLFVPWVSEAEMTTAHLIENDARGSLIFIDRARAICELKAMLEAQTGERLSQRQLVGALKQQGYELSQALVTPMEYAVNVLFPLVPKALRNGLGRPQINRIRRLDAAIATLLEARDETASADEARAWFHNCLAQYDTSSWLLEPVENELVAYLADMCDDSVSRVRLDLDRLLEGGHELGSAAPRSHPLGRETRGATAQAGAEDSKVLTVVADAQADLSGRTRTPGELMYSLARQFARKHDIAQCVLSVDGGAGYVVDLPLAPLLAGEQARTAAESKRASAWWFICALCDQWRADSAGIVERLLPEKARVRPALQALAAGDAARAEALVADCVGGPVSLQEFTSNALTAMADDEFKLALRLIKTRRKLCQRRISGLIWRTA
ncbi:MAG: ParB family protein [Gammaproteobacteria bacterium]